MKNLNLQHHSKGFGLAEVVIALAMVGILLIPILGLQYNVFKRLIVNKQKVEHLFPLKKRFMELLIEPLPQDQTTDEKQIDQPTMELVYKKVPVPNSSKLERFQGLFLKTVTGSWYQWNGQKKEIITQVEFAPLEAEDKKQQQRGKA